MYLRFYYQTACVTWDFFLIVREALRNDASEHYPYVLDHTSVYLPLRGGGYVRDLRP